MAKGKKTEDKNTEQESAETQSGEGGTAESPKASRGELPKFLHEDYSGSLTAQQAARRRRHFRELNRKRQREGQK